jgi:hypothetical protein
VMKDDGAVGKRVEERREPTGIPQGSQPICPQCVDHHHDDVRAGRGGPRAPREQAQREDGPGAGYRPDKLRPTHVAYSSVPGTNLKCTSQLNGPSRVGLQDTSSKNTVRERDEDFRGSAQLVAHRARPGRRRACSRLNHLARRVRERDRRDDHGTAQSIAFAGGRARLIGRGEPIRTADHLRPRQVRFQAALRPVNRAHP